MPRTSNSNPSGPSQPVASAVRYLLRPLVGFLISHGVTFPWLAGLLKSIYVDVARNEFSLSGKEQTDSRITLLTGVHRKDVRRFREEDATEARTPENVYLGAQLVALWTSDERFLDSWGNPAALPRFKKDEKGSSFEELVSSVSKDIRPRAVLDEWLRLGVVSIKEDNSVELQSEGFVPRKGFDEKVYYLGKNVHDHLAAARANVDSDDPPFLERSVYYDELSAESVATLSAMSREEAEKLLRKLNRKARDLQRRDRKKGVGGFRMNFGTYFFSDGEPPDQEEQ